MRGLPLKQPVRERRGRSRRPSCAAARSPIWPPKDKLPRPIPLGAERLRARALGPDPARAPTIRQAGHRPAHRADRRLLRSAKTKKPDDLEVRREGVGDDARRGPRWCSRHEPRSRAAGPVATTSTSSEDGPRRSRATPRSPATRARRGRRRRADARGRRCTRSRRSLDQLGRSVDHAAMIGRRRMSDDRAGQRQGLREARPRAARGPRER